MRVLVTGSAGFIGKQMVAALQADGHTARTFDRSAQPREADWEHLPGDLRDIQAIRKAMERMDAVLHLGAIPGDQNGNEAEVLTVNVAGTWNVLLAAVEAGVERVVHFSSVNALGCVGGHRPAAYLPIDDAYPRHPMSPYQLSKHLGEEACLSFTRQHGLTTVSLRPVAVFAGDHGWDARRISPEWRADWEKDEYWAYVDVEDVCAAALRALTVPHTGHAAFLLTADDTTMEVPTAELVARYYPETPWKQDRAAWLAENPHRALFDCSAARQVLGWQPRRSWRNRLTPE